MRNETTKRLVRQLQHARKIGDRGAELVIVSKLATLHNIPHWVVMNIADLST